MSSSLHFEAQFNYWTKLSGSIWVAVGNGQRSFEFVHFISFQEGTSKRDSVAFQNPREERQLHANITPTARVN